MSCIKLHDILWRTKNAGPSPDDNRRTELYFAGCWKALSGNPCEDCFNPSLWDSSNHIKHDCWEIVSVLNEHEIPKYVTIVGGEPTDQLEGLKELSALLKAFDYNVIVFSWRSWDWIQSNFTRTELANFDLIVTEPYDKTERIYDTSSNDGIRSFIGSGNQYVIMPTLDQIYRVSDLKKLYLNSNGHFAVELKSKEGD